MTVPLLCEAGTLESFDWFAVQVASGREMFVNQMLGHKGYETFLPRYGTKRQWSDRVKYVELPLFPGYVFCRFDAGNCAKIITTAGVIRILGAGNRPVSVSSIEIESVRRIVERPELAQPWPYARAGQSVMVKAGPLRGVVGSIIAIKSNYRIVVSIHLLQRSVATEIESAYVEPISQAAFTPP
jgi:transcription antitermination factor NusG